MPRFVYVGSETWVDGSHRKEGITVYRMDPASGKLEKIQEVESGESPSFLALHPNKKYMYAINESREGRATSFTVDAATGQLTPLNAALIDGRGPCYVSIEPGGRWLLTANYGGGSVGVNAIQPDGQVGAVVYTDQHQGKGDDPKRQEGPHAHSIIPDPQGKFVFSADLGTNHIYIYRLDPASGALTHHAELVAEPGAGPRHMAFHPNGRYFYYVNELNNTVVVCQWDGEKGTLTPIQTLPTLPSDFTTYNLVADVHFTPNGKTLYVSNRGHNSLAVYNADPATGKLTFVDWVSTEGNWPRNFTLDADGKFMIVANQESSNLVLYRIDPATGLPSVHGDHIQVYKPMFVTIVDL